MNSREEIISKYNFICDPDVLETVEAMMEEYAQQFRSPDMAEALRLKWITLTEDMGRMLSGQRGVSIDKLNKVMNLVQEFVNTLPASLSSPGSGWVKVEDGLPEIPPPYFENGLKLTPLGCRVIVYDSVSKEVYEANYYDGHFDDNNPDITHWQPLPTPPGVEDNQTKKQ